MEIKVLGPGCAKCKSTYNVIEKVLKENNIDAKLTKVDDIMEMMNYNIMTTPAVVIDEVVKMKGQASTFFSSAFGFRLSASALLRSPNSCSSSRQAVMERRCS